MAQGAGSGAGVLVPRQHIQNFSDASSTVHYWGYADRVVPCTNDAGSCAYLDLVYDAHYVGMIYTGIMWSVILGILLLWAFLRKTFSSAAARDLVASRAGTEAQTVVPGAASKLIRMRDAVAAASRRHLLPESIRSVFGHTTRLQVAILGIVCAYLTVFSFIGMYYAIWITPVKGMPGVYNTRSSLGPWSDRVGVLAYALTPLSIMLSSRESLLSLLTGVPYQSFVFMHRWLGYIIFVQSALHTIGWCIIEINLYQPQPTVALKWIVQEYMVWGLVAMILLTMIFLLSTKWAIRAFGYEFFRKAHYVLAMVYIGACIGHWAQLECFLIPAIVLWVVDRMARLVRTALLHYNYLPDGSIGFASAQAAIKLFEDSESGDVVRLDFHHPQQPWDVGQHFFLCFPELSIWQSHPMTPLAPPAMPGVAGGRTGSTHAYILRAKAGETKKLAVLAAKKLAAVAEAASPTPTQMEKTVSSSASSSTSDKKNAPTTSVVLTGPYGQSITQNLRADANVLCVAGGTGVTFVLPVLLDLARRPAVPGRRVEFVWAIRHARDMDWIAGELDELRGASKSHDLRIDIFLTRDAKQSAAARETTTTGGKEEGSSAAAGGSAASVSSGEDVEEADRVAIHRPARVEEPTARRPKMDALVTRFVGEVAGGPTTVFASGPLSMVGDLRAAVAGVNEGGKVWKGEERFNVRLVSDDRLEW